MDAFEKHCRDRPPYADCLTAISAPLSDGAFPDQVRLPRGGAGASRGLLVAERRALEVILCLLPFVDPVGPLLAHYNHVPIYAPQRVLPTLKVKPE